MTAALAELLLLTMMAAGAQSRAITARRPDVSIARSGVTTLGLVSPRGNVKVVIRTAMFSSACKCSCPAAWALGELHLKELSVTRSLKISVGGKSIFVPDSVYDHLFEPHQAALRYERGTFILRIDGMDASDSYFVRVYFDDNAVNRFVTYWSLVPDRPTSDTHYFRVELN